MTDVVNHLLTRIVLAVLALCVVPLAAAAEGRRVALVVSNAAYTSLPAVDAAMLDGQAMSAALSGLGFEVTTLTDPDMPAFEAGLAKVAASLSYQDTALFYYAGHIAQENGVDRLVPVAATLSDPALADGETWRVQDVADALKANGATLLMFLDASHRDALPAKLRPAEDGEGLALIQPGADSYLAVAAAPDSVDWKKVEAGSFSPFTAALLADIAAQGMALTEVMAKVGQNVKEATGSDLIPWQRTSLRAPFYFTPPPVVAEAATPGFAFAIEEVTLISAPPAAGRALYAQTARVPEDLARAVQGELKRVGCYGNTVDGDWGAGSRAAMDAYYAAKTQDVGGEDPTEALYRTLLAESDTVCVEEASAPKPAAPAKPSTKKPTASKPAAAKPAAPKPAAPKPAAPAAKPGVKCKFYGVAVICK